MTEPNSSYTSRRAFLRVTAAAAGGVLLPAAPALCVRDVTGPDPFTLGVASGEPSASGVVLWTKLAPEPLVEDGLGGMPSRPVQVTWELASDERFSTVLRRGTVDARPDAAHAVRVEVDRLGAGRPYYYRFTAMGHQSMTGRTRTAPAPGALDDGRFGVVSCSRYEEGYFTAYRHLADEHPDLVLHLGDYIYEYGAAWGDERHTPRRVDGSEIETLADYRRRYALYRTDSDLQALHATAPFAVVWDDHEVDNNWAGEVPEDAQPRDRFLARRAAAFQAYHEMMPLRARIGPTTQGLRLYRTIRWGGLANLHMLDTRQYRDDQPCGDGTRVGCAERFAPARTMLGATQEQWLADEAARSTARWDVLGQQVFFGDLARPMADGDGAPLDSWNGYIAARNRVLRMFSDRPRNLVVLTGDVHNHYAGTLHADGRPDGRVVGAELVTSSITSGGDGQETTPVYDSILARNPNIVFSNNRRGYILCEAAADVWQAHYRVVPYVSKRGAVLETRASYSVEAGNPGLHRS
jgi:alkaline phosphatase D